MLSLTPTSPRCRTYSSNSVLSFPTPLSLTADDASSNSSSSSSSSSGDEFSTSCRLYVGCVPRDLGRCQIISGLKRITTNLVDVIMYPSMLGGTNNRGFVFVEYDTHTLAAQALNHLTGCSVSEVWPSTVASSRKLSVDWAIPEMDVSTNLMKNVKVAFVRRLTVDTTEEELACLFSMWGEVERVKKLKDFAFVHMESHDAANKAVQALDGQLMKGSIMEVCLSKPVDRRRYRQWKQQKHLASPTQSPRPSTSPDLFFHTTPNSTPLLPPSPYDAYYLSTQLNGLTLAPHQHVQPDFYH